MKRVGDRSLFNALDGAPSNRKQGEEPRLPPADPMSMPLTEMTLDAVLAAQATRIGEKSYLWFEGKNVSFADVYRGSGQLAAGLRDAGVGKGAHVAVLMANHPNMVLLLFALARLGAVAVLLNTSAKGALLRYFLEQSDSTWLVLDAELLPNLRPELAALPSLMDIAIHACGAPALGAYALDGRRLHAFDRLFSSYVPDTVGEAEFKDVHCIMYTSGTTGPSKGVQCTHVQALKAGRDTVEALQYRQDDVLFTCLPLFHANAFRATLLAALFAGATAAFSKRFSASAFWDEIRASGATQFNALGAMAEILSRQPPSGQDRNHAVRQCHVAPAFRKTEALAFQERFGLRLTSVYGSTEIGCPTYAPPDMPADKWPSCGRVIPSFDLRIADEDGQQLPAGQVGEILTRPRDSWVGFSGYYKMPEATLKAIQNYWFQTGDRGYLDNDGYLYFVDRKKDSIRRRGENISAFELENILCANPLIAEAAVIGVASELGEEEVLAFLVMDQKASELDIVRYCETAMPRFMVPRYIRFIDELPKNTSGKTEKFKLSEIAREEAGRIWDRERIGYKLSR